MSKKKLIVNVFAVILSIVLLTGAALAYFTDRAATLFTTHTGTVEISSERPFAKMPAIYNEMNNISLAVRNEGNSAMDIKVVVSITSPSALSGISTSNGTHVLSSIVDEKNYTLPLYRVFGDRSKTYSVSLNDGIVDETGEYLEGTIKSNTTVEFNFNGVLNGKNALDPKEIVDGGVDVMEIPLFIYFPTYEDANNWASVSRDISYTVTAKIYGKQHRNSDNNDWALLGIV